MGRTSMARSTKTSTKTTSKSTKATTASKATDASAETAPDSSKEIPTTLPAPDVVQTLSKKELIDRVVESSGIKKKDAKPVIEAMLRELGDALSRGDTLNLQPFGKGIVKTRKSLSNAEVVEIRLRRSKQAMAGSDPTAPSGDDAGTPPLAEAAE